jgi:hypothetical protein
MSRNGIASKIKSAPPSRHRKANIDDHEVEIAIADIRIEDARAAKRNNVAEEKRLLKSASKPIASTAPNKFTAIKK